MRKDAKIGFAIGAVLLAVLTVYAIVVPKKRTASPTGVKVVVPQSVASNTPSKDVVIVDTNKTATPPTLSTTPESIAKADPAPTAVPAPSPVADAGTKTGDGVDWNKLVGAQPAPMMSTTPAPGGSAPADPTAPPAPMATTPTPTPDSSFTPGADLNGSQTPSHPAMSESTDRSKPSSPSRRPAREHSSAVASSSTSGASGQYVVEAGDTLSGIASEHYGAAHYYVAIERANPSINPNRLRPGTKITLPDLSAQIAAAKSAEVTVADAESPRTSIRIDGGSAAGGGVFTPTRMHDTLFATNSSEESTTYTVKPGDSLYRISKKLYGTSQMAHEIFKANTDQMGTDMARLKVGMVLTLPEAPTNQ